MLKHTAPGRCALSASSSPANPPAMSAEWSCLVAWQMSAPNLTDWSPANLPANKLVILGWPDESSLPTPGAIVQEIALVAR